MTVRNHPALRNPENLLTVSGNWAAVQREWQARFPVQLQDGQAASPNEYTILNFSSGGLNEYVRVDDEFYASVNRTVLPDRQSFAFIGEDWLRLFWLVSGSGDQELVPFGHNRLPSLSRQALSVDPGFITFELQPDSFIKVENLNANIPMQWVSVAMSRSAVQRLLGECGSHVPFELHRYLSLQDSLLMIRKTPMSSESMAIVKTIFDNPLSGRLRYGLLCSLIRSLVYLALGSNWDESRSAPQPAEMQRRIMEAAALLRQHAQRGDLNISDVARQVGISRSHFDHVFLATFGMSPGRYTLDAKMQRAAELLRLGDMPIKEISIILGYESQAAFYRSFRQWSGVSPTEYRARHRL